MLTSNLCRSQTTTLASESADCKGRVCKNLENITESFCKVPVKSATYAGKMRSPLSRMDEFTQRGFKQRRVRPGLNPCCDLLFKLIPLLQSGLSATPVQKQVCPSAICLSGWPACKDSFKAAPTGPVAFLWETGMTASMTIIRVRCAMRTVLQKPSVRG